MYSDNEIEITGEGVIHEEIVKKALAEQPPEEQLADLADLFKNFSDTRKISCQMISFASGSPDSIISMTLSPKKIVVPWV